MNVRRFNWPIWAGFLLSLIAFLSYFFVFVWFPVTRDFPWANLLLFALAAALLIMGVQRAFAPNRSRPKLSKITGVTLATLSVAVFGFFIFATLIFAKHLPPSKNGPQISQLAPEFTLDDTSGKPTTLSDLLAQPVNGKRPKGVLLVFYRGYW